MLIYPAGAQSSLRGDLLVRSILRSDLTPIPQTVEIEVRDTIDVEPLKQGATLRVGREAAEFIIVKSSPGGDSGKTQGDRPVKTRKIVALLASCVSIAEPLQRSVVRHGSTLGDIYRACGAQVRMESDFTIPTFACFKGMTPAFEIAKALQEEAGALVMSQGKVWFRRLNEMMEADAVATLREDSAQGVESAFLERHSVPFAFSTTPANALLTGPAEGGRGVIYRPRADARVLSNLATVLVMRRKVTSDFAPHIMAGMRFDIAQERYVVITAAHVFEAGADGDGGQQYSRLWLGKVVKP